MLTDLGHDEDDVREIVRCVLDSCPRRPRSSRWASVSRCPRL
jgi:hypothetical protein